MKWALWDDWFIEKYQQINLYIDNQEQPKDKWRNSVAPTMEFTTSIDTQNGCVVDCVFCPQRTLQKSYKGERFMTLDNFKKAVDKLPQEVRVTFAGFTEPWLNKNCTDMVLYAHEKGHPISIFTTGIGMSIEDIDRIKHIPFAGGPNGGFVLHLPDQERKAKHPITKRYIEVIEHFGKVYPQINNFTTMAMGTIHEQVRHVFSNAPVYAMWSRAGNLLGESIMKPELLNRKDEYRSIYHGEQPMTCGCLEKMYHNVMLPNGDVSLCCMDYGLEHILGNLYEQSYEDIIPDNFQCFNLCRFCENATKPPEVV
jgi:MoaA/NifB/PqqE/SkfB family radical SAM enzyme